MKENVQVSIAGISFTLDAQAYTLLNDYMQKVESYYKDDPDAQEIVSDIEGRVCELILSKQAASEIIASSTVMSMIEQLGLPEDLNSETQPKVEYQSGKLTRRLYRKREGAKLGGVCSGLGEYFQIDAVWVRLLFFAPLFLLITTTWIHVSQLHELLGTSFGAGFILYFLLWFVIPMAKTPRQKLEMMGEPVTTKSIHNNIKEGIRHTTPSHKSERSTSVLAELIYVIGKTALWSIRIVVMIIALAIGVGAIAIFVSICSLLIVGIGDQQSLAMFGQHMQMSDSSLVLLIIMSLLTMIIPMLIIAYLLLSIVFEFRRRTTVISIIAGIWIIILIFLTVNLFQKKDELMQWRDWHHLNNSSHKMELIIDSDTNEVKLETETTTEPAIDSIKTNNKQITL